MEHNAARLRPPHLVRPPSRDHHQSDLSHQPVPLTGSLVQRALAQPGAASPADLLTLQRRVGNRAVSGLLAKGASTIQAKLQVGPVNDPYEQEADRVADQVVTSPAPPTAGRAPSIQREPDEDVLRAKPLAASITPLVQRAAEEDEEVQAKPLAEGGAFAAPSHVEGRLGNGGGRPLDAEVRADMEGRFGSDFSAVRIHTGSEAGQLNRELAAKAFTHGANIYFGPNQYAPGSQPGRRLLAHELTHVIQQKSALVQRKVIQRASVNTAGGTWKTNTYIPVPDGAQIELEFQPNATVTARKIGLIQKSLKVEKGVNYDVEARRKYEAGEDLMPAQKRKAQRSEGLSHLDRDIKANNPIYGAPDLARGQDLSATPLSKLDMSAKAQRKGTASNYQLGYRYKSGLITHKRSAKLWDRPNLPGALNELTRDRTKISEMTFETTAVCLEGADKDSYYGSVQWGWKLRDPAVGVELLPLAVKSAGATSASMKSVMTNWNAGEFKEGEANPQIPLPP
jgi:hypothetical protein